MTDPATYIVGIAWVVFAIYCGAAYFDGATSVRVRYLLNIKGVLPCQCPHCDHRQGYDQGRRWWRCDSCGRKFRINKQRR